MNRNLTDKRTTVYKDIGEGVSTAGMEAIKTILDIQASQLTLVSPSRDFGGGLGGSFNLCDHG